MADANQISGLVSMPTAMDIALAYREVETAEKLLEQINESISKRETPDFRDTFGRLTEGLQLGVPSGNSGQRLFNLPWTLARPIIEAHIGAQRAKIRALTEKARAEITLEATPHG